MLQVTTDFFNSVLHRRMEMTDVLKFMNLWYISIVINDALIVAGTMSKISIEFRDFDNGLFTLTGIFLGLGALLVYFGLLRYLGFFSQYNVRLVFRARMKLLSFKVLILTLKRSAPSIGRFMVCTLILYAGFLFAGWVIIGPYSIKVRLLASRGCINPLTVVPDALRLLRSALLAH